MKNKLDTYFSSNYLCRSVTNSIDDRREIAFALKGRIFDFEEVNEQKEL